MFVLWSRQSNHRIILLFGEISDKNYPDSGRYAITDNSVNWADAETQVKQLTKAGGGKQTVISLKSSVAPLKRKTADASDVGVVDSQGNSKKKTRRGGGGKKAKS